jgi:predicted DCC family thiol-disulfide oxidoreductase YuxK
LALLIYDGDCTFCKAWVAYWREATDERVQFEPYQTAAERFPQVPVEQFKRAAHFVADDGAITNGAQAAFQTATKAPGRAWLLWAYRHAPGFSAISEAVYRWIAEHRNLGYQVTRLLWGRNPRLPSYAAPIRIFLRLLAVIYTVAFVSFGLQARGLIGAGGILPLSDYLQAARGAWGSAALWRVPTVFWLNASDGALLMVAFCGAALAVLLFAGLTHPILLGTLFVLHLSLVAGGQDFMSFQWDVLLVEMGFLAIFLKPVFSRVWLMRWLIFRLMFLSGAMKLLSGDSTWRSLTALGYHYQTQPLPTPLAWYVHQAPEWFGAVSVLFVFFVELIVPFLALGPPRPRMVAAIWIGILQVLILLTGNYTYFNWAAIALCVLLIDGHENAKRRVPIRKAVSAILAAVVLTLSTLQLIEIFVWRLPHTARAFVEWVAPLRIVNTYGLFASMTTTRPEIVIEGSSDGVSWREYEFRHKPGDVKRPPDWVAPHQPRLDWQMWFAALGNYQQNQWFVRLMARLLEGSPAVLGLLASNPFESPPRYVRALLYEYRFTTPAERRASGAWWVREARGTYFPQVSLGR